MTQLARPDLARNGTNRGHVAPAASAVPGAAQLRRLARSAAWRESASQSVPGWAVISAFLAPGLLVGAWLISDALQTTSYSPVRQTMSVLAGHGASDRWVMTSALFVIGVCQIVTAIGLTRVGTPARILLVVTGLSSIGVAASPEPAAGPTPRHLAFAVICVVATAAWPALIARRSPDKPWILTIRGCTIVTGVFAVMSAWVLIESQGGNYLGLAERLTSSVQGIWPFVVALALRQAARQARNRKIADEDRPVLAVPNQRRGQP